MPAYASIAPVGPQPATRGPNGVPGSQNIASGGGAGQLGIGPQMPGATTPVEGAVSVQATPSHSQVSKRQSPRFTLRPAASTIWLRDGSNASAGSWRANGRSATPNVVHVVPFHSHVSSSNDAPVLLAAPPNSTVRWRTGS